MADEQPSAASVDATAPTAATAAEPVETAQPNAETMTGAKEDEELAGKQATTETQRPDGEGTTEVADVDVTSTTPASGKKEKRKSTGGGVPEHKSKKLNRKKSTATLRLDCQPGDYYWARLKGFPPWPSIICDELMLPESLLATRPVSTTGPNGALRDDFKEGGKNAKERTFPVMFLSTNEFSWMVNTALTPLEPEECKTPSTSKMTKTLKNAYALAAERHDLDFYKGLLKQWQDDEKAIAEETRLLVEEEEREAAELAAKKAAEEADEGAEETKEKKKKKKPRKSKGGDEDVEMEDAEAPKSLSKKRKKEAESDAEGAKPKKTPKVTKLNAPKTPNSESSAKKSSSKPRKTVSVPKDEEVEQQKPQLTEKERVEQREKGILYLRHRLQKGFLTRDQAPQESEMAAMAEFFGQLEAYHNLEPVIIRKTKIHKVLKAIVKLAVIPKDEEMGFKKRSAALLEVWNKRMEADGDVAPPSAVEAKEGFSAADESAPTTNGHAKSEELTGNESKEDAEANEGAAEDAATKGDVDAEKAVQTADKIEEKVESELQPKTNTVKDGAESGAGVDEDTSHGHAADAAIETGTAS